MERGSDWCLAFPMALVLQVTLVKGALPESERDGHRVLGRA